MTKLKFTEELNKAREIQLKLDQQLAEIYYNLPSEIGDLPTGAENADNIEEAISCYIHYGEYNPEGIWNDLVNSEVEDSVKDMKWTTK